MRTTNNSLTKPPDNVKPNGQCGKILAFLKSNGSITDNDARDRFGCNRLAARICDLRSKGFDIHSEWEKGKNRYGETINYVRYYLREERNHE